MKIGSIIPIRLASERLPGKAIKEVCGKPLVCHLLDRTFASKYIINKPDIVVCTTEDSSDDPLVEIVINYGVSVYRGSTNDIIKRFYNAIQEYNLDYIIQVDGDDILCATEYMDLTMEKLLSDKSLDIVTCEGLPLGIASKSFTQKAMNHVYNNYQTDHNDTGFIYFFTKTGLCKQGIVYPLSAKHVLDEARLTLDYQDDFELFKSIFEGFYKGGDIYNLSKVLDFLRENPNLLKINAFLNKEYWQRTRENVKLEYASKDGSIKTIRV